MIKSSCIFIKIADNKQANNKASSSGLVHYLEKENRIHNIAKLGRDDAKFFLINISPSQKEIAFLKRQYREDGVKDQLKAFAVRVMDAYAQNFKRKGVESYCGLVWFGKLENYRYYCYNDPEVK
ncbi:DUF5712 family protein [Pedobacter soli]|uniref:DUF5712 family protein n=1 Tax=Pedobacter soli TaxID=390242 RepID=UPI003CC556D8